MKKLFAFLLVSAMTASHAGELKSFNEIYNSIEQGKNIRLLINFDNCTPKPPVANIEVYTTPTAIMLRKNYLQFANTPLTTNNPKFSGRPVLENCTYQITNGNELKLTTRVITLPDYGVVSEVNSDCPLGTAVKVFD